MADSRKPKGNLKHYIAGAVLAGGAALLFYLAASAWGGLTQTSDRVWVYLTEPILAQQALELSQKSLEQREELQQGTKLSPQEQMPDFCIWGQRKDQVLSNESLHRSTQAELMLLCGNPELVFPGCTVPAQEDGEGCLIDEQTAWELFGSLKAEGRAVSCDGKSYTVRKVIPAKGRLMAVQVQGFLARMGDTGNDGKEPGQQQTRESGEAMRFTRMVLAKPENPMEDVSLRLAQTCGISGQLLELELLRGLCGGLVLLVPVTFGMLFFWYLWREREWEGQEKPESLPNEKNGKLPQEEKGLWRIFQEKLKRKEIFQRRTGVYLNRAAAILLLCMLLAALAGWVRLPEDYIPTRWSDFTFWTKLWEEKLQGLRLLLQMPKAETDLVWVQAFLQCLICGLLAEGAAVSTWIWGKRGFPG